MASPISSMPSNGLVRVVTPAALNAADVQKANQQAQEQEPEIKALAAHVRARMTDMKNFRNTEGIGERLIAALRAYKGMYDAAKLNEIRKFGGSEVYARITSAKCRAATALLRDVYLGSDRPWAIEPTPVPSTPEDVETAINELVKVETATIVASGQPVDSQMVADRVAMLRQAAETAAKKQAEQEAIRSTERLDDLLREGNFYEAFAEFLIDLPIFPFACIKGPVVRRVSQLKWVNGIATRQSVPKMFWYRVSPFDLYWSPGASNVDEAEFVERIRLTRAELIAVKGLPGYNTDAIDQVLERFNDTGFREWWDATDAERARLEEREQWPRTATQLIDTAEYHGNISGSTLLDWGMTEAEVPDPLQEYYVQAWLIDRFVIKVQINPTTQQRAPYYISNFEKIPGTMAGYGLPDLLEDIQDVSNATLRALVNNLSIASGPQVVINDAVLLPGEDDNLYPWKRWHVNYDPMLAAAGLKPIDFYQPNSHADVLLGVFEKFSQMGDEVSAIPRYMMGNERIGGAGRTASGLAMLMGNASKTLQNVAATIDRDVFQPLLNVLYDMVMLSTPGVLRGDEKVAVKGVAHAQKREQERLRQLEFLQMTANPIDIQIMGMPGRATVLRSVAGELGLPENVVPDEHTLKQLMGAMGQGAISGAVGGIPAANQQPKPQESRASPEAVRESVEGLASNNTTGRPGMRAGG
jgi:hypothetical protein